MISGGREPFCVWTVRGLRLPLASEGFPVLITTYSDGLVRFRIWNECPDWVFVPLWWKTSDGWVKGLRHGIFGISMSTVDPDSDSHERKVRFAETPLREARLLIGNRDLKPAGFGGLVREVREGGLRRFRLLSNRETGTAVHVVLDQPVDEGRLSSLESVKRWGVINESKNTTTYIIECTPQAFPPTIATRSEDVIGPYDLQLTEEGILMSILGPHGHISGVIEEYEAVGFSPNLRRIGSYDGYSNPLDALTERQREVLTVAFEMQYYQIPRNVCVEDIAAEIDINSSTAAEHLQRAEAKLLALLLADQP